MNDLVDDFIKMNEDGLVLALCEKYYDKNVVMLSNGVVFAESMRESYDKQKGFVNSIVDFDVALLEKNISGNISELIFHYRMTGVDKKVANYKGKHVQTWKGKKIIREEYYSIND